MNRLVLILIALVVLGLIMTPNRENYFTSEAFGFSGYTKPRRGSVVLDDLPVNKTEYTEVEAAVDNDVMNELVVKTNEAIAKRTGMCTHIIETTQLKKYQGKSGETLYEVMFMAMKHGGFSYGFSVVAALQWKGQTATVVSLRTQPMEVESPSDVSAFTGETSGKEFLDFEVVRKTVETKQGELLQAKQKLESKIG
jgi:hypothetical protein